MAAGIAILLTVVAGAVVAIQAPINSELGRAAGSFPAAAINFLVGTLILVCIVALAGQAADAKGALHVKWYYLVGGGLAGALYVTTVLITVRSLGAAGVTAATITGQLAMSILIDRLGVLGLAERPLTVQRVLGVALLAVGTYLVIDEAGS